MDEAKLSPEAAYLLRRLAEEILEIDRRAGCSDRYFRQHFTSMARVAAASGILKEIGGNDSRSIAGGRH